ncbi:MAG: hypothetical protein ACRC0J_23060, partial [Shewanella oncorhynchi]
MKTAKKKPRGGIVTRPETAIAKIKAAKAVELRMEGKTFDEIAAECGYKHRQSAFDAVKRALEMVVREPAKELIKIDLERLDKMWTVPYLNAQSGDVQALAACIKIMERRSKLLGLDTPEKHDVTSSDGTMSPKTIDYSKLTKEDIKVLADIESKI